MQNKPTFIDLFAGAGGASYGLVNAGFQAVSAVEVDKWASDTYELNHPNTKVLREDIKEISDFTFQQFRGIDLIVGGPPCQGFSISASNRRKKDDPRNNLYLHYVRAVKVIKPKIILVENVKEILKFKLESGKLLHSDFISKLEDLGYNISYRIINAKHLGVPQDRIRFFMVGALKTKIDLNGLETYTENDDFFTKMHCVTLDEAIGDLPIPISGIDKMSYFTDIQNEYQRKMREGNDLVVNHEPMRHTKRLIERFKYIPIEGNTLDVPHIHRNRERGNSENFSGIVFHQNHRRLNPNKPCRTITASFYSSFIHPYQHRNLTVREAARIQGFSDKFIFTGKRTTLSKKLLERKGIFEDMHLDQFNQVGNSVPPIMAEAIGKVIINKLL